MCSFVRITLLAAGAKSIPRGRPIALSGVLVVASRPVETGTPDGVGRFNHFQGGSISWTPRTGANEVHGLIRAKWESMGWERSRLGYPTSDERPGPKTTAGSACLKGGILWTPEGGAVVQQRIDEIRKGPDTWSAGVSADHGAPMQGGT